MMATTIFIVKSIRFEEESPLKVTKEKVAENRAALVQAAGRLFRERGIDGVGVAEISKKAGLTHGALYAQFPSKEALAAEAFASAFKRGFERMTADRDGRPATLTDYLDYYLSFDHRDNVATSCAMSACVSEVARQDKVGGEEGQVEGARGRARATRKRARGLRPAVRTQLS